MSGMSGVCDEMVFKETAVGGALPKVQSLKLVTPFRVTVLATVSSPVPSRPIPQN